MEEFNRDIVLLYDSYDNYGKDLFFSFQAAGIKCPVIVIQDDGFLPEDCISAYGFFLGDFSKSKNNPGRPRYFNEITVPDYWEISSDNRSGKIHDLYKERGHIFYAEPLHKRLVKIVDWLDERGVVRSSDHYNQYGALFARTTFNAKGDRVNKSYFSAEGKEVIVENFVTGDIILNEKQNVLFFRNKTEFVAYFIKKAGYENHRLFFNSLSYPFFVSQFLHSSEKRDILFWQEPIGNDIPGNMQVILKRQATRTEKIMVQKKNSYEKLLELGADSGIIQKFGYVYQFEKENNGKNQVLICTNSDRIEHCKELVEALPQLQFHIAALTEMSSKLQNFEQYDNVSLYPNVRERVLEELFDQCDFYLDINHENEIVSAVRQAFLHNHLILAFENTIHNSDYIAKEHIYNPTDYKKMVELLTEVLNDHSILKEQLDLQYDAALTENEEQYKNI